MTICYVSKTTIWLTILAFIGIQLQGTLYNYYVILRNKSVGGDTTSKVFEYKSPRFSGRNSKIGRFFVWHLYYCIWRF
jgi:hypothetical protein